MKAQLFLIFCYCYLVTGCESYDKNKPQAPAEGKKDLPLNSGKTSESEEETENETINDGTPTNPENEGQSTVDGNDWGMPELLKSLVFNVIWPNIDSYQKELEKLKVISAEFCANTDDLSLEKAQEQWRKTMYAWQKIEIHKVRSESEDFSALSLSHLIYHFNLRASPYFVFDEAMKVFAGAGFNATKHNSNGLDAMEVLLFDHDPGPECSDIFKRLPSSYTNASLETQSKAKCKYINLVMEDLQNNTQKLVNSLDPSKSNFLKNFAESSNPKNSMQSLFEDMYSIETSVKDVKLGIPTGSVISPTCNKPPCPCRVEHIYSKSSSESIDANMESFSELLRGASSSANSDSLYPVYGINDYLRKKNQTSLAHELELSIQDVKSDLSELQPTNLFREVAKLSIGGCTSFENSDKLVCRLFNNVKKITDIIKLGESSGEKSEFLKTLEVDLPTRASGDSD
ncbi:MAG: hypothetical protein KBD78_13215 [Oligoflexales bacterium]|nr:hypothetical protein [Oligoflexales bacterium]